MPEVASLVLKVQGDGVTLTAEHLRQLQGAAKGAESSAGDLAKRIAGFTTVADIAVRATQATARAIIDLGKESIVLAAGFEKAKISWGVLLGDMDKGAAMFEKIRSYAAETPLSFEGLESAARMLAQYGMTAESIMPTLAMLGDVSMGDDAALQSLARAFGQIQSTGRLMGQDLLQLINAGFNPLLTISEKTGESMTDLKARMEKGGVSADEVTEAFKAATEEGGRFYGMMDKTAETTSGKWSTAMDNFKTYLADIGEKALPLVNRLLDDFNEKMDRRAANSGTWSYLSGGGGDGAAASSFLNEELTAAQGRLRDYESNPTGMYWMGLKEGGFKIGAGLAAETRKEIELIQAQMRQVQAMLADSTDYVDAAVESTEAAASKAGAKEPWKLALEGAIGTSDYLTYLKQLEERTNRLVDAAGKLGTDTAAPVESAVRELERLFSTLAAGGTLGPGQSTALLGALEGYRDRLAPRHSTRSRTGATQAGGFSTQGGTGPTTTYQGGLGTDNASIADGIESAAYASERLAASLQLVGDALGEFGKQAYVDSFKSLGEALASGANAGEAMAMSLADLGRELLDKLPMMLLNAGLTAISVGQVVPGLALIGASGLVAFGSGIAEGSIEANADGNVYSSPSLHQYANKVYDKPQFFAFARGGVFAEAGSEAIMPLARDSSGRLGVRSEGGANVSVVVNNNAPNTQATATETTGPNGERQIVVAVEAVVGDMVRRGKLDGLLARGGMRPVGART